MRSFFRKLVIFSSLVVILAAEAAAQNVTVRWNWLDGELKSPSSYIYRITDEGVETNAVYAVNPASVTVFMADVPSGHEVVQWSWGTVADGTAKFGYANKIAAPSGSNTLNWHGQSAAENVYLGVHLDWLKYELVFDKNGGSGTMPSLTSVYNETKALPNCEFTREGYCFKGWSRTKDASGAEFADQEAVSGETFDLDYQHKQVTLYAVWEAKTVALTFDPQEGSVSPTSISVTYDQTLGELPTPTKTGYTFKGWFTEASGGTQVTDATVSKYEAAATVYARWSVNNYTITVGKSGEGTGSVSPSGTISRAYGSTITLTAIPGTGSKFVQWSDGITTAERTITVGATDETYTAQFDLKTFTVTFDPGEGAVSPTSKIVTYGKPYGELPKPTWTGHTFDEWKTAGGSRVTADDTVRLEDNIRLTAKYTVNTHLVQVVRNTASEGLGSVSGGGRYDYGTTVTIQAHANDGSKFTQWSDGDKNASREITVTQDKTYAASFDLETYTVKFIYYNAQEQQVFDEQIIKYGKAATAPENSVVDQYPKHHFTGWGNNSYGTVRGNLEVQALYEWDSYSIRFNVNAPSGEYRGSMGVQTLMMDAPHPLSRNNFSRTGHTFLGWSRDQSATTPTYHDEESVSALTDERDATVDLYAVWQPNTYTITFNPNGDDATVAPETKTVTYGETYGDLPTPERPANSFRGWYTTRSGTDKIESTTKVAITANQTLYAQWTSLRKTITYNLDGGRNPDGAPTSYVEGEGATLPIPTRTGYVFKGWYTDAALTSEVQTAIDKEAKGEKTFYARWRVKYTALTLNANGGELAKADSVRILEYNKKYQDVPNIYPTHRDDFSDLYRISVYNGVFSTDDLGRGDSVYYTVKALDFLPPNATFTYRATVRSAGTGSYSNWEDGDGQLGGEADGTGTFDVLANENLTIYSKANAQASESALDGSLTAGRNGLSGFSFSVELSCGTNGVGSVALPKPTRIGWAFDGWYTEPEGGTRIYDTTTVSADPATTLYAHWRSTTFKVVFDPQGGSVDPTSKSVILGLTYGTLPTPSREGYNFDGWYTSTSAGDKIVETTTVERSGDHTLYAHWKPKTYAVTTSGENCTVSAAATGTFGNMLQITWMPSSEDGYDFKLSAVLVYDGESVSATPRMSYDWGTSATFTMSASYSEAIHIHGVYTKKAKNYSLRFNSTGGGSCAPMSVTYGQPFGTLPIPQRKNYEFLGWTLSDGTPISDTTTVTLLEDTTLYATWRVETYTISYDANGGTGLMDDQVVARTNTVTLTANAFTRTGYTFVSWTNLTQSVGQKAIYSDRANLPKEFADDGARVELQAQWSNNVYIVRFYPNGGKGVPYEQEMTYDVNVALKACKFTCEDAMFAGWLTDTEQENEPTHYDDKEEVQNLTSEKGGVVKLFATWTGAESIENELSHAADCDTTADGHVALALSIDESEYWIASEETPAEGSTSIKLLPSNSVSLSAVLEGKGKLTFSYRIHFVNQSDSVFYVSDGESDILDVVSGDLPNDAWQSYAYEKKDVGSVTIEWTFLPDTRRPDDCVYIDAIKWMPESGSTASTVGVTFRRNDGSAAPADIETNETRAVNAEIGECPSVTREGYEFLGWATSRAATEPDVSTTWIVPVKDTQLYAVWKTTAPTADDAPVIDADFSFTTDARFDYVIWFATSLSPANWTELETVRGTGESVPLPMTPSADRPQCFFKVEVIRKQ